MSYNMQMKQEQLHQVYDMVDNIPFSRPKKNINRDFADGLMLAELIHHYSPKLVSVHNYPAANSLGKKIENLSTLNLKVLKKIGINLSRQEIQEIANAVPNSIEKVLYQIYIRFERPDEEGRITANARRMDNRNNKTGQRQEMTIELDQFEGINRQNIETRLIQTYQNFQRQSDEQQQVTELRQLIQQSYLHLCKLQQLNKAKQDVIRNLQKKLQKYIFT